LCIVLSPFDVCILFCLCVVLFVICVVVCVLMRVLFVLFVYGMAFCFLWGGG